MIDAGALATTHLAAFGADKAWSASEFRRLLHQHGALLVGDARSFVLGRVIADEAEILTIATAPDQHRKGYARAALTDFEHKARDHGAVSVFLEVAADNFAAQSLYRSAGYEEVGLRQEYYARRDGHAVDAMILRKILT